jgi:glutathione peroxidase
MMKEVGTAFPDDVVVVAVPCNAFGRQESGTPEEIAAFAKGKYPDLLVTERSEVNGPSAHPIMALGLSKFPGSIGWNFDGVFVFDKEGKPAARFGNAAMVFDVKAAVEKLI